MAITIELNNAIEQRAKELEGRGFKALDALHLASAEAGGIDYFCTCTEDREQLFGTLTVDEIIAEIKRKRPQS